MKEKMETTEKKPIYKKGWFWLIIIVVILFLAAGFQGDNISISNNNDNNTSNNKSKSVKPIVENKVEVVVADFSNMSYEDITTSRQGLIKQLKFEEFTQNEATYAVDKIGL